MSSKRARLRSNSNLSTGSNNERLSHKEALQKKYDVLSVQQANNISVNKLDGVKLGGIDLGELETKGPPKGLNNMGNT
jgi:hypothetical protein